MKAGVNLVIGMVVLLALWSQPASASEANGADATARESAAAMADGLQQLVNRARPGETVEVPPGTYHGPLIVSKPIHLVPASDGEVVLINTSEQPALLIEAGQASVSGLRIEDTQMKEAPSVLVQSANRVVLANLHVRTGSDGIAIHESDEVMVLGTSVEWGAARARPTAKGNGIDLFRSHRAHIDGNAVSGMYDAIYVEYSDDALVENNRVERSRYGIHTMYSDRPVIRNNIGEMNVTGGMVMTSRGGEVTGNRFAKQSENVHSQGILLFDAHGLLIADNGVEGNRVGIYVEQSTDNRIERNVIEANYIGVQLLDAEGNRFSGNALIGNVADAQAIRSVGNDFHNNYWSDFQGIDADGDGVSDIGYAVNPFFLGMAQHRPAFQLLFQSPGMVFLEGLFQADRSSWTMDTAPLMAADMTGAGRSEMPVHHATATGWIGLTMLLVAGYAIHRLKGRTIQTQ